MFQSICFKVYVSKYMFQSICFKVYASKYMFQSICFKVYISKYIFQSIYLKVYTHTHSGAGPPRILVERKVVRKDLSSLNKVPDLL